MEKFPVVSALQLYKNAPELPPELRTLRLTTGCPVLDEFLGGGILSHGITEVSGESASGKTQLCLQLSLTAQLPKELGGLDGGAIYICTEDAFPNKRLMQMIALLQKKLQARNMPSISFSDHIFVEHAAEMDDLMNCIEKKIPLVLEKANVKLVIIDSIAALFRCEFTAQQAMQKAKILGNFGTHLHKLSSKHNVPVICVNQVTGVVKSEREDLVQSSREAIPSLGMSWSNLVTTRLMVTRTNKTVTVHKTNQQDHLEANVRTIEVIFAPHLANRICYYIIDSEGVKGLS